MKYPERKVYFVTNSEGTRMLHKEYGFCLKFQQWLPLAQSIPCGNTECREECRHFVRREGTPYFNKAMRWKMRNKIVRTA